MERTLFELSLWFDKNGLKVNADKAQLIVIGSRQNIQRLPSVSVKFMGATVAGSPTVWNLDVVFDQNVTFSAHTDDVVRRCTCTLCGLRHCRHCLPQSTLIRVVEGLVVGIMIRYCISVYGSANKTQLSRLQRLLNFGSRESSPVGENMTISVTSFANLTGFQLRIPVSWTDTSEQASLYT